MILCTGTLSEEIAVEALRKGLDDYVLKDPRRFMRLPAAVRSAIDHARQRAAARAAELRYHELFDGAPVGLIRCLPDGRILAANAAAARIAGFPGVAALLAANVADLYADVSDRARVIATLERGETLQDLEMQGRRQDGVLIWVTVNVRPVKDAAGRTLHYEWSLADITERRLLESQLRQAQKMEAVGQLAGGVAHDFNNLLTVIGGRCYLMLGKLGPDDALRREVELVRSAAERAARLTHQLLAFSRKQVLEPRVLDLNETVTGIEPLLRRLIGEDIEISVTRGSGLGRVKADAGQLEQVILNLAVNARDAMPQGGRLVLETANAVVDEWTARRVPDVVPGNYVMLSVTDSGHGMDAATRGPDLRAVLHHQGGGEGHRARAGDGVRHRQAERRLHRGRERAGPGRRLQGVPARGGRGGGGGRAGQAVRQPACAARRRCSSWRTTRPCAISPVRS